MSLEKVVEKCDYIINNHIDLDTATIWYNDEILPNFDTVIRTKIQAIKKYFESENKILTEINLIINSHGGDFYSTLAVIDLYDELYLEGIKVNVKSTGICMSAATLVISAATGKRVATKRCRFMVHELQLDNPASYSRNSEMRINQYENDFCENEMYTLYALASLKNKTFSKKKLEDETKIWKERCIKDFYFNSEMAKKFGLIDDII